MERRVRDESNEVLNIDFISEVEDSLNESNL